MECFCVNSQEIEGRINPFFYRPYFLKCVKDLEKSKYELLNLKDVCKKITDGTHFTPKYKQEGIKFLSVKDVREDKISFDNTKFISSEEHQKLVKRCKPESGDILLTKVGTVGLAAVIPENAPEFSIFVSVALLKIDKSKVIPEYVCSYLNSSFTKIQIERVLKGIGVPDLHLEDIANIKIPIPNKEIQKDIIKIVNKINSSKEYKKTESQKLIDSINDYVLDELGIKLPEIKDKMIYLVSSEEVKNNRVDPYYFQPKFEKVEKAVKKGNFEIKELKEITDKLLSGQRPKGGVRQIETGIPSLGGEHVLSDGKIKTYGLKFIPEEFHKTQLKSRVMKKDILIVKDGATTGKVGIIPEDYPFEEANINEHVFLLRVKKDINPYFVFSFLKSKAGQIQINRDTTGGTITGIIRETTENIKIPLPPLSLQNKIADEVKRRMQKAETLQKEAKEELEKAKLEVEKIILG